MPTQERIHALADTIGTLLEDSQCTLLEQLEIVANLLIRMGAPTVLEDMEIEDSGFDLVSLALEHRRDFGETWANATVVQGLTMLAWLNQGDSNVTKDRQLPNLQKARSS